MILSKNVSDSIRYISMNENLETLELNQIRENNALLGTLQATEIYKIDAILVSNLKADGGE